MWNFWSALTITAFPPEVHNNLNPNFKYKKRQHVMATVFQFRFSLSNLQAHKKDTRMKTSLTSIWCFLKWCENYHYKLILTKPCNFSRVINSKKARQVVNLILPYGFSQNVFSRETVKPCFLWHLILSRDIIPKIFAEFHPLVQKIRKFYSSISTVFCQFL